LGWLPSSRFGASVTVTMRNHSNYLIQVEDDGLPAPIVGPWSEEKYRRLGMYAEIFATGMKNRWAQRVYLDLFSGPGHAIIRDHGFDNNTIRVLTSPLLALKVPHPFDRYIFCDQDTKAIAALHQRASRLAPAADVHFLAKDVNLSADDISSLIPHHSPDNTVLSLCIVDPYKLNIHFETIRQLGQSRAMDFVILLATDMDGRRNWTRYLETRSTKVAEFLGSPDWRDRWGPAESSGKSSAQFLAEEYSMQMAKIGYLPTSVERMIKIRTYRNNMQLYYLAFFSKHQRGNDFWDEVRKYSTAQLGLL